MTILGKIGDVLGRDPLMGSGLEHFPAACPCLKTAHYVVVITENTRENRTDLLLQTWVMLMLDRLSHVGDFIESYKTQLFRALLEASGQQNRLKQKIKID